MKSKKTVQSENRLREILQKLINDANITERALARALGIPPTTLYQLVNTENPNPFVKTLLPIAKYFNVSIEQLMGEKPLGSEADKSKKNLLSTKEWNPELFIECINVVTRMLKEKGNKVSAQTALDMIREVYIFTLNSKPIKVDTNFVEWFIDRALNHST